MSLPPSSSSSSEDASSSSSSSSEDDSNHGGSSSKQQRIKIVVEKPNPDVDPIVVSFPGGLPPANKGPVFECARHHSNKEALMVLKGKDDTCNYHATTTAGSNNNGNTSSSSHHHRNKTKLCVGVLDKKTGQLRVHQAAQGGRVLCLSQSVSNYQESTTTTSNLALSAAERRRLLFESFGSAKKRKVLQSQAANVVSVDSVVGGGAQLSSLIIASQASHNGEQRSRQQADGTAASQQQPHHHQVDAVEAAYAEARRRFLPPFDANATAPHKVYSAETMAGEAAWDQISRVVDAVLHKRRAQDGGEDWIEALTSRGLWFSSVETLLKTQVKVGNTNDVVVSSAVKHQIKCAILLNQLMRFHRKCTKSFFTGTVEDLVQHVFSLSQEVGVRFLEVFATPMTGRRQDGFAMTKQHGDKRIIYMLILYMLAHGNDMKVGSFSGLCQDIRLQAKDVGRFLKEAGCTVKQNGSHVSAALTVPLKFPPPKRGRRSAR